MTDEDGPEHHGIRKTLSFNERTARPNMVGETTVSAPDATVG